MLMRACDVRLPARLQKPDLDFIAGALIGAAEDVMGEETPRLRHLDRAISHSCLSFD